MDCIGKVLKLIVESYPNLEYFNIFALPRSFGSENNIGLSAITQSYHKLKYLNISIYKEFSEISICNIICSYPRFQQLDLNYYIITDITTYSVSSDKAVLLLLLFLFHIGKFVSSPIYAEFCIM